MTLVLKTVKGKKYVYEQYRRDGIVVTKYLGPLEEMVRVYQLYKALGKVEKLSKRDIRRLARTLLQEYDKAIARAVEKMCVVNSMENGQREGRVWWTGRDLNPGPPPCEGGALPAELPAQRLDRRIHQDLTIIGVWGFYRFRCKNKTIPSTHYT